VFKGSGWYINDSRDSKKSSSAPTADTGDKATEPSTTAPKETSEKKAAAAVGEA
jgi:predicted nucleic acid-binding Zn ribbon protein